MEKEREARWFEKDSSWNARIEEALAAGAPVFRKNGLPIVCQRAFDGALLEHEHADHPDYMFPVEVEYAAEKPDCFVDAGLDRTQKPEHDSHDLEWTGSAALCKTCGRALSVAEVVHLRAYAVAEVEQMTYEPHDEALIYHDRFVALTLHEHCYALYHRRGGGLLHGPTWAKDWKLSDAALKKIWPEEGESKGA